MKSSFISLFQSLPETELPLGLESRIFERIAELRLREARRAILVSYARLAVSGGLFVMACFFVGSTILGSEFVRTLSLLFSDMTLLAQYGSDFFWLVLETFPVIPVVLLLTPLFFLLVSVGLHKSSFNKYRFSVISSVTL